MNVLAINDQKFVSIPQENKLKELEYRALKELNVTKGHESTVLFGLKKVKRSFLSIILCLFFFITSCSSNDEVIVEEEEEITIEQIINTTFIEARPIEIEILDHINDYRVSKNLPLIKELNIIKVPALIHTLYMIEKDEISHDEFQKRSEYLVEQASIIGAAENVASGFITAESVVNAWIASDGHRKNIEGDYNYFDVIARQNSNGRWYYTNIFVKI